MPVAGKKLLSIIRIRGRNGFESPLGIPDDMAVDVRNMDFFEGMIGRKRPGSDAVSLTFSAGGPFTAPIASMFRHVPGNDLTAAEWWAIDSAATPVWGRMAGAATFTAPTRQDEIQSRPQEVVAASLNGKLFLAYDSAVDRLHVWDGSTVRRTGLATPAAAPTVANSAGGGAYPAILRYYKVIYTVQSAGVTVRRSAPSASVSFTPSGVKASAVVTKPAAISEGETHWELYASADDLTYVLLATTVVGTLTYSDTADPNAYSGTALPTSGLNTLQKSYRFIVADGNRLLGFGSWEAGNKNSRIEFTPVLGTSDIGDDERIPNTTALKYWIDLDEADSGFATGLSQPFEGVVYAFKYNQIHELIQTGQPNTPYVRQVLTKAHGCIAHKTIVTAEDELGNPALYFLAHDGPRRIGRNGLEWVGRDIKDLWDTVNLGATSVVAHAVWHRDKQQVWFFVATGASNDPDTILCFDTTEGRSSENGVRYGWTVFTGNLAAARSSVLMSRTLGASMSLDLKPYIGRATANNSVLKGDTTATSDAGTAFQAYVTTKAYPLGDQHQRVRLLDNLPPILVADAASAVTLSWSVIRDFGLDTRTFTASLTPTAAETKVIIRFEGTETAEAAVIQFQLGDAAAVANGWTVDQIVQPYMLQEPI